MDCIFNKSDVCEYLKIPSIPNKRWDGKKPFNKGVAVIEHKNGEKSYAVAAYNDETKSAYVKKVFSFVPFVKVIDVFIIPDYMSSLSDVAEMDLDETSKKAAEEILNEASEIHEIIKEEKNDKNEYYFDFIKNDSEAKAFIESYNKNNKIKGRVPTSHEGLVMRLSVIYADKKNKKAK